MHGRVKRARGVGGEEKQMISHEIFVIAAYVHMCELKRLNTCFTICNVDSIKYRNISEF